MPPISPCRPTILQDEEFSQVQGNLEGLQNALPGADVLKLVAQQVKVKAVSILGAPILQVSSSGKPRIVH